MATNGTPAQYRDLLRQNYAAGEKTYILTLTFPSIEDSLPHLTRLSYGTDMWELRADLLSSTSPAFVSQQISLLRANSELPILFTVRTVSQGGKFPDEMAVEALELLQLAVEAGCDYVDVETSWPVEAVDKLRQNKADTILVASWTDPTGAIRLEDAVLQEKYIQAEKIGGT